jgi:hypothetical protein
VLRHVEVQHSPRAVPYDRKNKEQTERRRGHREEVARDNRLGVSAQGASLLSIPNISSSIHSDLRYSIKSTISESASPRPNVPL